MRGRTVLITGATTGLGRQLARDLAVRGARLLLHGRDEGRLAVVVDELSRWAPAVRAYRADLADLDQVRALAADVRRAEPRLDVLVNNAAVAAAPELPRQVSRQGHELSLAVNHLAPYLLVRELAPLLAASAPARVVNVASMGQVPLDFDDLMFERDYDWELAYCRSKLALIMSTFALAPELRDRGVTVNAVHPAHLMDTPMVRSSGLTPALDVDQGALPTLRLVVDSALDGVTGRYFDRFDDARAHAQAYDAEAVARLMAATRGLVADRPATSR
ncbi:SDR family NAD(P)-dependent oxidoreductase [Micromonospora coxensis]|uniref:Short-chain dehydrogenase n=1 Tax=Micromonospora coxensis TaxID=356852 RepID=A0A1C5HQA3_9ACTN|nr:SDR family NAD(P)-dependent oxidoreductase [Micromonospora coxensis]SCG48195.1 Short-chain dehydrogenase [Micromonospora coxensis]